MTALSAAPPGQRGETRRRRASIGTVMPAIQTRTPSEDDNNGCEQRVSAAPAGAGQPGSVSIATKGGADAVEDDPLVDN